MKFKENYIRQIINEEIKHLYENMDDYPVSVSEDEDESLENQSVQIVNDELGKTNFEKFPPSVHAIRDTIQKATDDLRMEIPSQSGAAHHAMEQLHNLAGFLSKFIGDAPPGEVNESFKESPTYRHSSPAMQAMMLTNRAIEAAQEAGLDAWVQSKDPQAQKVLDILLNLQKQFQKSVEDEQFGGYEERPDTSPINLDESLHSLLEAITDEDCPGVKDAWNAVLTAQKAQDPDLESLANRWKTLVRECNEEKEKANPESLEKAMEIQLNSVMSPKYVRSMHGNPLSQEDTAKATQGYKTAKPLDLSRIPKSRRPRRRLKTTVVKESKKK